MALNINGTTGISGVDGSASAPALQGTDSNTGINFASDTVNINTGGSTRATIDSSGNLGLGTASPTVNAQIQSGSSNSLLKLAGTSAGSGINDGLDVGINGTDAILWNREDGSTQFGTNNTERMRIRSNGTIRARSAVSAPTNTATYNENNNWNSFSCNSSNGYDFKIINQNSSPAYTYSLELAAAADVANANYRHISCTKNSNSSSVFVVYGHGNVANVNNSYGATSDVKLKENIIDAKSQWDDIKGLRVRNFNFIADSDKTKLLGLVAQEAEAVCPSLVQNIKDVEEDENGQKTETGTVTKELKYSVLYMKAIKALQEAQTRIETLETKVAALEAG